MATAEHHPDHVDPEGLSRRTLLQRGAAGGIGLAFAGSLELLFGSNAVAKTGAAGYGPLVPDPARMLSLPEGFSYELLAKTGVTPLEGGGLCPADFDGAASFVRRGGNGSVLIINHEIGARDATSVPAVDGLTFNPAAGGGTTTVEVDKDGNVVRHYVSLSGTNNNCAGGRTPWETWLTCEETEGTLGGVRHGYVFEVDPHDEAANRNPKPIKALGRFAHESVTVDPGDGNLYMTEDASNPLGLFFRFTPPGSPKSLGKGSLGALADDAGELDAMRASKADGTFVPDLSAIQAPGTKLSTSWVAVPDRDAKTVSVRRQAFSAPPTRSRKLEGMWAGDGGTYFVASYARTESEGRHEGQVWFLDTKAQTIELKLIFASTPGDTDVDGPDNITVSPYGGVILAEDGNGEQHLVGATPSGETFFLAKNALPNEQPNDSEFAGPTFSRDKKTLFAAIQSPGHLFAITGPWENQK